MVFWSHLPDSISFETKRPLCLERPLIQRLAIPLRSDEWAPEVGIRIDLSLPSHDVSLPIVGPSSMRL